MKDWLKRVKTTPWVAHLLRASTRFTGRLGNELGAAITYFSVLAVVPILMFAFAVTGFVMVEVVPGLRHSVTGALLGQLGNAPGQLKDKITGVLDTYLENYAAIGVIGLLSAMYAGAGWIGNLKSAVRAQWRPDFDAAEDKRNIVVETLINLAILLGLLVLILVTFGVSSIATSASDLIIDGFGLARIPGISVLIRLVPIVISIGVGWLLFMFLYVVLPQGKVPAGACRRGALIAAVGLAVLQYLTGILFKVFAGNAAAAVFGPIIVLMLFFNMFARLTLFLAAWIATTDQPALPASGAAAAVSSPAPGPAVGEGQVQVPQQVAARSVRLGMGAGYVTGAATGFGAGAVIALVASSIAQYFAGRPERRRSARRSAG